MKNLGDIHGWERLTGQKFYFNNPKPRQITHDFNVAGEAPIYVHIEGEEEPRLLAYIKGRETVRFVTPGRYNMFVNKDDVDVYLYTRDGKHQHRQTLPDEEVYTTLHEVSEIDHDLAKVMDAMNRRINLRVAQQVQAALSKQGRENAPIAYDKSAVSGDTGVAKPEGGSSAPAGDGGQAPARDDGNE